MRENIFKKTLILAFASFLCLTYGSNTAFGQCGPNGTSPCRDAPKTAPRKVIPRKNSSKADKEKVGRNSGNTNRSAAAKKPQTIQNPTPTEASGVHLVVLTGKCRFQLVEGFFPCDSKVLFAHLANGRSLVTFIKHEEGKEYLFTLSGGTDRQPSLENYYLGVDTFRMKIGDADEISDDGMEGECHFRIDKTATNFFSVKCDIYNRGKGTLYNFYLESISKTDHQEL